MNHNKRWQKHYDALVTYYERYGDALVPSGHIEFLSSGEDDYINSKYNTTN